MSEKKSEEVDGADEEHGKNGGGISRFRTALPQVLASTAKNLILLELGMTIAFPTIVIPALHNVAEQLSLDDDQASWLGSLSFIFQPIGSILSGMVLEPLGRKRSMIVVNIPQLAGWLLLYWADSVTLLYTAAIIMGMGVGFMEAPIITYVGEISQPHLRGILTSYAGICAQLGFVLEFFLGTVTDWRTAAIISAVVPIITALAITQVPETPIWLLSRGRKEQAEKSLCWLRGWVSPSAVRKEFQELVHYHDIARKKWDRRKASRISETLSPEEEARIRAAAGVERHRGSQHFPVPIFPDKKEPEPDPELVLAVEMQGCCGPDRACTRRMEDFFSPSTMKPLLLVVTLFFFQHAAVVSGLRPYLVEVVRDFGMPIDAHWGTVYSPSTDLPPFLLADTFIIKEPGHSFSGEQSYGRLIVFLLKTHKHNHQRHR
ncbi:facilitated trehalose transporter Tret1 [Anabrus simplex]|uniref:facilitated trehalose transporter Tret1 n=1 Tax=Anabrus simplex TaxID=316456 RepID=UPI0035A2FDEA